MANINEILARAAALRDETALNSIDPERAGGIMYDTLIALNELWLQQGAALVISKIYASVAAMNADTSPVSDLTGQPIRPGMIVVIASSDTDNGSVYRYNGTSSPRWSLVGNIGDLEPVDSLDSDSTQLPLAAHQGKVLDGKISQLGQEILMPNEKNLKDYIINGIINESTGEIVPDIPTRLTTSIYFKKVLGDYLIIDQTNSATKFSFGGYKHTQIGTAPEWIPYQQTNIIQIRLEDGYFYSLYIANGSNNISPSDLADVKISYGFYDEVKRSLFFLEQDRYYPNKLCVKSNADSVSDGIGVGDKGVIKFSFITDQVPSVGKCLVKNTPNNNVPLYIDFWQNKYLFRIGDTGDTFVDGYTIEINKVNKIEFEWDGVTTPNSKTYSLKINGVVAASGNYQGTIDGTIKIQNDGSFKCIDAIWLYCKIDDKLVEYNNTFESVDDPVYKVLSPDIDNLQLKYDFLGTVLPNIVSNFSNETYMDLGPDPGIMVDGQAYWFSYWYPNNSDAYRRINLKQYTEGESALRVIVADLVEHTISNIPYFSIVQNSEQYKNCVVLFSFCIATPLPQNIQGIAYTINGTNPFDTLSKNYAFFGNAIPNIVSDANETYLDLGPDPGIMVDGQVYWFSYWFPEQSSIYRHINLRYLGSGESALRAIVVNLASKTISNVPYHSITSNKDAYRNSIVLCTFCRMNGLPVNLQGIDYTINGGGKTPGDSIVELNPDIVSKVANSARAFHYDSVVGTSPLNLIYFSDIHGDTERTRRLFELREIVSQYIDDVLFTGDSDNYPNDTAWWNDFAKQMLIALGNHEYMIEKVEGVWQHATPQQAYDKFIAPYKPYWTGVVFPDNPETGKSYYYKDYATKKVRLIALDYMEINLNPGSTQIAWFTSILDDVLANHPDYHVVIAVHQCAFKAEQNFKNPFDSIDFNSDDSGVLPVGIPQAVDAFINNGGHFVCYFTGHDHVDHFGLGENYPNQLNISICCASMSVYANTMDVQRVADTKSQDLFNIVSIDTYSSLIKMIRVGCDYDRQLRKKDTICFYYGNDVFDSQKTYQIGQIVLYQSKIYQFLRNYNGGGWNPAIVCEIDRLIYC